MSRKDDIESQISSLPGWAFVSDKQGVLRGLSGVLSDGEKVSSFLEGLYRGYKIPDGGGHLGGLLCLTEKRLVFVSGEGGRPRYEEIDPLEIDDIRVERSRAHITLTFALKKRHVVFKTFNDAGAVERFTGALRPGNAILPPAAAGTASLLDEATRAMAEIASLTEMLNRDLPPAAGDRNALFNEALSAGRSLAAIAPPAGEAAFGRVLAADLLVLASLCVHAGGGFSRDELAFTALAALPLDPHGSGEDRALLGRITSPGGAAAAMDDVLKFGESLKPLVPASGPSEDAPLRSLALLGEADRREGTDRAAKAAAAMNTFCQFLAKADGTVTPAEEEKLRAVWALVAKSVEAPAADISTSIEEKPETLEEVLEKIDALVGMANIKEQIRTFVNLVKVQKERESRKMPVTALSLHSVFYGPPGTGKTTIARHLGRVYRALGLLKKGHIVETDRAGLVAGYVGQTALNVDKVVEKALDGVLFIDEAYALTPSSDSRDYGHEAVDTILKRMEDNRERLAVIVAGYTDEMERFIESNPGLKSRFSRYFYFDHYSPEELRNIFDIFCKNVEFALDGPAEERLMALFTALHTRRDRTFGNGRLARNLFEKVVERQANRIAAVPQITDEILRTVEAEDIPSEQDLSGKNPL